MANKNKLMEKAQKYLQKGKLKETISTLNEVIEVDPTDFRVLLKKGELESRIGDNEAAKTSYTQVAEQYSQDGFYLKAIAIYKKILKLDSEEFHIYSKLAYLYRKLGLDTEAKKNLKVVAEYYKAKGLRTNYNEVAMQLTELGESVSDSQIAFVEKLAEGENGESAVEQFRVMSKKYQDGGNVKQLDNIVKKMEELRIKDLECYHIQALGYLNCNEPKKSLQVIQKAYGLDLQNSTTLELLARCFTELKQPQKAISVFNELVKIYDRSGDMKNFNRIKSEIAHANGPIVKSDSVPEFQEEPVKYNTVNRDESDEFTIEEVQMEKPEPKKIGMPAVSVEYQETPQAESSISELDEGLGEAAANEFQAPSSDQLYNRTSPQLPSEDSFMNVYVDAFDGSEDTVLAKSADMKAKASIEPDADTRKTKPPVEVVEQDFLSVSEGEEIAFSFSEENFESTMDIDEATKIDVGPAVPEKSIESTADLLNMNFEDEVHEETVLEAPAQKQQMIGFDDFYSDNQKEKSEISVYEEEFVSISQFLDEAPKQKPLSTPEKIEIHDKVLKPTIQTSAKSNIKHENLATESLSADIESTVDFSTLDLSEINLKIPGMEDSKVSISSNDLMNSLLDDAEPETNATSTFADQINLDEKTILDIKHEFKESSKAERLSSDDSFFDLASELHEEISEFEKSFGTMDEDAEEEFLSPEEVILEFKKGIARTIDKSDHQTHYNLGVAYKEMGLIDEAISAFELASNHNESRIDAISMIGICLADKNDYETAVKLYLQVLPTMNYQDSKYLGMMYQLGDAYMELRQHVDAYKAFSKVKDLDASFRDVKSRVKELGFNLGMSESKPTQQSGKMIVDMKDRKKNKF